MTADAKLPIPTYYLDPCGRMRGEDGEHVDHAGVWCKDDDVGGLVERMDAHTKLLVVAAVEEHFRRALRAEARVDRLVALLRRTMTDTACVEVDGPGCWFCDWSDGEHAADCEAAKVIAEIEEGGAS